MKLFGRWWRRLIPEFQPKRIALSATADVLINDEPVSVPLVVKNYPPVTAIFDDLLRLHAGMTRDIEDLLELREAMDQMLETSHEAKERVDQAIRALVGYQQEPRPS